MFKNLSKLVSILVTIAFTMLPARGAFSLPGGENVVSGSAAFDRSEENTLNVNQASDKLIADYNSFSIAAPEAVHFLQPSSSSVALNRVIGVDPSSLLGTLTANGKIFLINPNGILFGKDSRIDTAGLVASTLNISNSDFLAGRYTFIGKGGSVINQGYISALGGYVSLLGSSVENTGVIEATLGSVVLASGKALTLNLDPEGLISVVVDEATIESSEGKDSAVKNSGTIKADGGKVLLTAKTLEGVFDRAVNNEGIIEAKSLVDNKGEVTLLATGTNNLAENSGVIDVSAKETGAEGGEVEISGDRVILDGQVNVLGKNAAAGSLFIDPNDVYVVTSDSYLLPDPLTDSRILESFLETYVGSFYLTSNHDVIFDVNDNHLNLANFIGADFSTNPYTAGRNFSVSAKNHIDLGNTMIETQGGSVNFYADNDNTGMGSVYFGPGSGIKTHGGNIDLRAANIYMDGATLEAIGSPSELGYEHQVNLWIFAQPWINGAQGPGEINIKNSTLTIEAGPSTEPTLGPVSHAQMDIGANTGIGIENSKLTSKKTTGNGDAWVETDSGENLSIKNSEVTALVNGNGTANLDFSLFGNKGTADILGSILSSKVKGEGKADIYLYNDNALGFNFPIFDTQVDGPINGKANIVNSTLHAEAASTGGAGTTATIGLSSLEDITLTGCDLSANEANGMAAVGLWSKSSIHIDAGKISADGGNGFGAVGLLASEDLFAGGDISALGKANGEQLLEDALNELVAKKFGGVTSIDLNLKENCGSAILLGSDYGDITLGNLSADLIGVGAGIATIINGEGAGSIFDIGDIDAHYLGLLAKHDIGTKDVPLKTNVDSLGAYSFGSGNIYIDQSAKRIELGFYLPLVFNDAEGYPMDMALDFPIMANSGSVRITSASAMVVNSIVAPNGGVYLCSMEGSIYAGHSLYGQENWFDYIMGGVLPKEIDTFIKELPLTLGIPMLGEGSNVFARGYSYFSALKGTIGVGTPEDKDPAMSAGIQGFVSPGVEAVTGVDPSIDFDGYPDGYAQYYDTESSEGPLQVWPLLSGTGLTFKNPLRVDIEASEVSVNPAVRDGFTPVAGLTLQFAASLPPSPPENDDFSQFASPLSPDLRAYYEILNVHRVSYVDPATPTTFFAYHPLTPTDTSAFDQIALDVGAYDFISDSIKLKKSLSPYFGEEVRVQ